MKEIQRKGKRKKNNPWPGRLVVACILSIIFLVAYQNGRDYFKSFMITTTPAVSGLLEEKIQGDGLIFVREKIITAPYSGKLKILVPNGERIRHSQAFAHLAAFGTTAQGKEVQVILEAPMAGVMFYWWDGLENIFTPAILGNSDIEKVFSAATAREIEGTVHQGEPVSKVVDNLEGIYCVVKVSTQAFNNTPAKDDKLTVSFSGFRTSAIVRDYKKNDTTTYLLLQLSDLPDSFAGTRHTSCVLIPQKFKGVVLPKEAIVPKNQEIGVYVMEAQKTIWQKVRVVGELGGKIVVDGLEPIQEVILNPEWTKDGEYSN